jgi:hypothetical protein
MPSTIKTLEQTTYDFCAVTDAMAAQIKAMTHQIAQLTNHQSDGQQGQCTHTRQHRAAEPCDVCRKDSTNQLTGTGAVQLQTKRGQ